MVVPQAFNRAGDTLTPTMISLVCFWLVEIPLAYVQAIEVGVRERGAYRSIVVAETLAALVAIGLFRAREGEGGDGLDAGQAPSRTVAKYHELVALVKYIAPRRFRLGPALFN